MEIKFIHITIVQLYSKKIHKLNLVESEIVHKEKVEEEAQLNDSIDSNENHEDKGDVTNSETNSKIIIDEDSTDNQFKLEL